MSPRFFSGNESWVFAARTLDQLCGWHAALATDALGREEAPVLMVYSPTRDADGAPFDLRARAGSHGLIVTDTRAIVTHDPHQAGHAPSAHAVAWTDVLALELGEALTLGWLSLVVGHQAHAAKLSIPFAASGIEHFRAVVRWWRQRARPRRDENGATAPRDGGVASAPAYFRSAVEGVLNPGERLVDVIAGAEVQGRAGNGRPACPATLCAMSSHGLLLAESERPCHREAVAFGVNLVCVDWRAVCDVQVGVMPVASAAIGTIVVTVRSGRVTHRYELPVGGAGKERLHELACGARQLWSAAIREARGVDGD